MHHLYKKFWHSIKWNGLESLLYHGLLLTHQVALFNVTTRATYGLIGITFSYIFLCKTIINVGLDTSLGAFWNDITASRQTFKKILGYHLAVNIALAGIISMLAALFLHYRWPTLIHLNSLLLYIALGIMLCESLKKTGKTIIQLNFLNHMSALIETVSIVLYITLVWSAYFMWHTVSLHTVFVPMLCVSFISMLFFVGSVMRLYFQLPQVHNTIQLPHKRIIKSRLFNYLNQLSHTLFSGNFLIPFFAMHTSLAHIGTLKLITHISHEITSILRAVFGQATYAVLARTKNMSTAIKKNIFSFVTHRMHQALYIVLIFFVINYHKFAQAQSLNNQGLLIAAMYFIITFSENFFMLYEKFFITEEKSHYLLGINGLSFFGMYLILTYIPSGSTLIILASVVAIRILAFVSLSIISFYTWHIKPNLQVQQTLGLSAVVFSLLFFFIW